LDSSCCGLNQSSSAETKVLKHDMFFDLAASRLFELATAIDFQIS